MLFKYFAKFSGNSTGIHSVNVRIQSEDGKIGRPKEYLHLNTFYAVRSR